jgi:hypothetical protein
MPVVLGDLGEPLGWYAAAPGHVFQEREDVVGPFRATERDQQERVVLHTEYLARYRECPLHHPEGDRLATLGTVDVTDL